MEVSNDLLEHQEFMEHRFDGTDFAGKTLIALILYHLPIKNRVAPILGTTLIVSTTGFKPSALAECLSLTAASVLSPGSLAGF